MGLRGSLIMGCLCTTGAAKEDASDPRNSALGATATSGSVSTTLSDQVTQLLFF